MYFIYILFDTIGNALTGMKMVPGGAMHTPRVEGPVIDVTHAW
jgi:hypothetical protein